MSENKPTTPSSRPSSVVGDTADTTVGTSTAKQQQPQQQPTRRRDKLRQYILTELVDNKDNNHHHNNDENNNNDDSAVLIQQTCSFCQLSKCSKLFQATRWREHLLQQCAAVTPQAKQELLDEWMSASSTSAGGGTTATPLVGGDHNKRGGGKRKRSRGKTSGGDEVEPVFQLTGPLLRQVSCSNGNNNDDKDDNSPVVLQARATCQQWLDATTPPDALAAVRGAQEHLVQEFWKDVHQFLPVFQRYLRELQSTSRNTTTCGMLQQQQRRHVRDTERACLAMINQCGNAMVARYHSLYGNSKVYESVLQDENDDDYDEDAEMDTKLCKKMEEDGGSHFRNGKGRGGGDKQE